MKQAIVIFGAALLGAACLPALAQQKPDAQAAAMVASAPGTGTITSAVKISARVESIDKAQRQLTLKGPKGNLNTVTAGPDVRNFDQIKVGDMVVVRYLESLTLTLKKDGKELRTMTEKEDAARSKQGEKPGAIAGRQVEVTADVIDGPALEIVAEPALLTVHPCAVGSMPPMNSGVGTQASGGASIIGASSRGASTCWSSPALEPALAHPARAKATAAQRYSMIRWCQPAGAEGTQMR